MAGGSLSVSSSLMNTAYSGSGSQQDALGGLDCRRVGRVLRAERHEPGGNGTRWPSAP